MVKFNLEMLAFVIGIVGVSLLVGWLAWSNLGFLTADAPVLVKNLRP